MVGTGHSTLRAKYLDWCSARLAERFLDLSAEEIYALARPDQGLAESQPDLPLPEDTEIGSHGDLGEGQVAATSQPVPRRLPRPTDEGYRVLVQRVTEALLKRTSLPTFDQWSEAYAESPERFDGELLGFWKDAVESAADGDPANG